MENPVENPAAAKMVTTNCVKCGNVIDISGLEPGDGITCPYCNHEFTITRQFGNFLLEKQLGAGGMGAVYLARDVTLNRVVAVKVLRPELVSDQKFMATFLREAEITASLNHPNIVQVFAFGQHEGVYYMVVEYISGGSLDDKIGSIGRITELEGIEIGIAVARGLECALQRGGLIHRDIKPGNILFNSSNTPKVVDFGLSLSFDTTDHFDGEIWGTPYYVAPEKLEREREDFRSDLYSLGATLFHAISGRPPYEGEDPNAVAMKHLSGKVVSLKAFVPNVSDQTAFAVKKAMARHPEDRYESYADFIEQLEDAKRRITDPNYRKTQRKDVAIIETKAGANTALWLMIGLVVVVVALIGVIIWRAPMMFKQGTSSQIESPLMTYVPAPVPTTTKPAPPPQVITPPSPPVPAPPTPAPPHVVETPHPPPAPPPTPTPIVNTTQPTPPEVTPTPAPPKPHPVNHAANLALDKTGFATSSTGTLAVGNAFDGDPATLWKSDVSDDQSIYVDILQFRTLASVVIKWGPDYARHFKLQLSNDSKHWTDAAEVTDGAGGTETISVEGRTRYVRMLGIESNNKAGYSIGEFEVYAAKVAPRPKPAPTDTPAAGATPATPTPVAPAATTPANP